ncbi:mdm2-binding protein isoform X2 [Nerophis ophidion]|uniref:mdm2-binding protein isoform X2 n=1 Tax=Nerophis ophidion TaxID=159077 RepID=UPI002AE012CA|nr:mdm2-binding protein isoform X2 [Nerophis ophidion]
MDRYVLFLSLCQTDEKPLGDCNCLQPMKEMYDQILDYSSEDSVRRMTVLPACPLSGSPSLQRWYFAVQACHGATQFCSSEWEDLGAVYQRANSEEEKPTALEMCVGSLSQQEESDQKCDQATLTELLEEAAEGLHTLSDKLPPPGKALFDVLVLGYTAECPALKDLLPLLGALRHMTCWHSAKITVITQHTAGWRKTASYLSAGLVDSAELRSCIDPSEMWRGGLMVREKKVFQYYAPVLDLLHLVTLSDMPSFLMSNTLLELYLAVESVKSKLVVEQLRSLSGKVGALLSLSCVVTPIVQTPASQISSQRWRESLARRPKSLSTPDVDVKGEHAHYFLLVQGSDNMEDGVCTVRVLHSDSQINGAAAMATVSGMLGQKLLSASGGLRNNILYTLPCLQGDGLLRRERKVAQVQALALQEYIRQKEQSSTSMSDDLKTILNLAKEQYLMMSDATLSSVSSFPDKASISTNNPAFEIMSMAHSIWSERSVLKNMENLQKRRQKRRYGLLGPGPCDSLLGPKDFQKGPTTSLDAKELLRRFTLDGKPASDLQPLVLVRGPNVLQLSPDLSPRRVSQMSFRKASLSNYHGIEYCLDSRQSLDRDQAFLRLQSRLVRYETQTTCCKEPSALPFALSPAPSPAVMSEPGSVPDGETLQNADVARLKRRCRDTDGYPRKRLVKSESSESLCSQSSGSSGTHPAIRSLRQHAGRSQSASSSISSSSAARQTSSGLIKQSFAEKHKAPEQKSNHEVTNDRSIKESRSQKHNRMLQEVVAKTLKHHGVRAEHKCFKACSKRLFDISKFYLKDLKTSRGLHDEMKKAAGSNARQVIDWVLEKT